MSSPDYDTVQTVGMTLATILFLLGILIILSKCDPFLSSKAPPRGSLGVPRHLQFPYWLLSRPLCPVSLFYSLSLLTGKKVKCRKASFLENLHGQRSLAGHSLRGRKESDMTEHTVGL